MEGEKPLSRQMAYYYAHREEQLARVKKYSRDNREKINQREREKRREEKRPRLD